MNPAATECSRCRRSRREPGSAVRPCGAGANSTAWHCRSTGTSEQPSRHRCGGLPEHQSGRHGIIAAAYRNIRAAVTASLQRITGTSEQPSRHHCGGLPQLRSARHAAQRQVPERASPHGSTGVPEYRNRLRGTACRSAEAAARTSRIPERTSRRGRAGPDVVRQRRRRSSGSFRGVYSPSASRTNSGSASAARCMSTL